ncbi:DUF3896 family protein [Bacillus cereus]
MLIQTLLYIFKLAFINYEYILNLVEMNHYERGFFSLKAEIRLSAFHFEHFTTHFS